MGKRLLQWWLASTLDNINILGLGWDLNRDYFNYFNTLSLKTILTFETPTCNGKIQIQMPTTIMSVLCWVSEILQYMLSAALINTCHFHKGDRSDDVGQIA